MSSPIHSFDSPACLALFGAAAAEDLPALKRALNGARAAGALEGALAPDLFIEVFKMALEESHPAATLALLLDAGMKSSAESSESQAPLSLAVKHRSLESCALLIERGAALDGWTKRSLPPLIQAALTGHAEIARALLAAGADPNMADAHGCAPLHVASQENQVEIAALLLSFGANPSARWSKGDFRFTPRDLCSSWQTECSELLTCAMEARALAESLAPGHGASRPIAL